MKRPNPISPGHLAPHERLHELCRLLALGVLRLRLRNSDQYETRDGKRDHSTTQSLADEQHWHG